ncbi:MAG: hypothetical protein EU552_02640 [Promethearchaeota archaeon]|nr:MAG: hypothetical protein EU552_02640 [Candidatus Lokiarchaeota archaeon]
MMSLVNSVIFDLLKESAICEDLTTLKQIFQDLIDYLKRLLNLDLINNQFELNVVDSIKSIDINSTLFNRGLNSYVNKEIFHVELFKYYQKFFPFFLLISAYKMFIFDEIKESKIIDFTISQIVDFDLQDYNKINDWRVFIQEKSAYYKASLDKPKSRLFMRYLQIEVSKPSESPKIFFFKFLRWNTNLVLNGDLTYFLAYLIQLFKVSTSEHLLNDELTETIRILVEIFYNVKNCDTLKGYYMYFKKFKEQKLIQTNLSFRNFRKNLRWIDTFSFIAPTYYADWKSFDQAVLVCHLKFNPLLNKHQIDKVLEKMPFVLMPKLSINNFAVGFSAYFVLPRVYIKDLVNLLETMERNGYIISKELSQTKSYLFALNLNYLKESHQIGEIIDLNKRNYIKNYELEFKITFHPEFKNLRLSLLDYLILESIRFTTYERINISRLKLINKIKSDLSYFLSHEYKKLKELEDIHKIIIYSSNLINEFISYLEQNKNKGFFYLKEELELLLNYFSIIEESNEISNIQTFSQLFEVLEQKNTIKTINENRIINEKEFISDYNFIFHSYFEDKANYKKKVEKYHIFYKILKLCSDLKILNINSIKRIVIEPNILNEISELKKNRIQELEDSVNQNNISSNYIHQRIDYLLDVSPKMIKPYLLDSVWIHWSFFPEIVLKNTPDVKEKLQNLIKYFPKVYFYEIIDLEDNIDYIFVQLHLSYVTNKEKLILTSFLSKLFKDNVISFKRYTWDGILYNFSTRDFYNFNEKEFFYTNDLFDQYRLYIKNILGEELTKSKKISKIENNLLFEKNSIEDLIETVNKRVRSEEVKLKIDNLQKLIDFHLQIEKYLINKREYEKVRKEEFFKDYIKSIKIIPAFHSLGLSKYLLYITPYDLNEIDFRLLLTNSFQKIKLNSQIDTSNSFLISYLFPYADPNNSYLNWLRGQNKIREYSLFKFESFYQIFHFSRNLGTFGWDLNVNSFKKYIQEILYEPKSDHQELKIKEFTFGNLNNSDHGNPDSPYFKSLMNFYNWHSTDIKKKLQFLNQSSFDEIRLLIEKKVIYPYLKLKNLGFKEIVHFFLINIKEDTIDFLKKMFQYFNMANIYEVKGEYYIHGFDNKKKIKKGLVVKLFLPDCRIADFLRVFEYVFQFLKVEKYLILTDLVNGEHFVKSVFGENKIFKTYNPLNNLIWDPEKKIWKNHKLFGPKFEYLYPDLDYSQQEEMS